MTTKTESAPGTQDIIKLVVAGGLLLAALVGFYVYSEASLLYRVLGLLAVVAAAAAIALTTMPGKALSTFLNDSRAEVRKVVWPSRTETVQTTIVVFVMVIIMGVFLWLLDVGLGWLAKFVIG